MAARLLRWASGDPQADYGNKQCVFAFPTWSRGCVCRLAQGCTRSASSTKRRIDPAGRVFCPAAARPAKLLIARRGGISIGIAASPAEVEHRGGRVGSRAPAGEGRKKELGERRREDGRRRFVLAALSMPHTQQYGRRRKELREEEGC